MIEAIFNDQNCQPNWSFKDLLSTTVSTSRTTVSFRKGEELKKLIDLFKPKFTYTINLYERSGQNDSDLAGIFMYKGFGLNSAMNQNHLISADIVGLGSETGANEVHIALLSRQMDSGSQLSVEAGLGTSNYMRRSGGRRRYGSAGESVSDLALKVGDLTNAIVTKMTASSVAETGNEEGKIVDKFEKSERLVQALSRSSAAMNTEKSEVVREVWSDQYDSLLSNIGVSAKKRKCMDEDSNAEAPTKRLRILSDSDVDDGDEFVPVDLSGNYASK